AAPEVADVLEGAHGDGRANRAVGQGEVLDAADAVDAGAGADVEAEVLLAGEQGPEVGPGLLALDLEGADLEDGPRQVEGFRERPGDAVKKGGHAVAPSRGWVCPARLPRRALVGGPGLPRGGG